MSTNLRLEFCQVKTDGIEKKLAEAFRILFEETIRVSKPYEIGNLTMLGSTKLA
jgi:hypothetical protein